MSWSAREVNVDPFNSKKKEYHVLPNDEALIHQFHKRCTCCPQEKDDIITHNSFDGREFDEELDTKLEEYKGPLL